MTATEAAKRARGKLAPRRQLIAVRMFGWVAEPRHLSALVAAAWVCVAAAGVYAYHYPPSTIANELGSLLTTAWTVLFVIGGALAVIGALPGWWYLERAGIILLGFGLLIYDGVIWYLQFQTGTSGNRATQALIVLAMILLCAVRYALIFGATLDPRRGMTPLGEGQAAADSATG